MSETSDNRIAFVVFGFGIEARGDQRINALQSVIEVVLRAT